MQYILAFQSSITLTRQQTSLSNPLRPSTLILSSHKTFSFSPSKRFSYKKICNLSANGILQNTIILNITLFPAIFSKLDFDITRLCRPSHCHLFCRLLGKITEYAFIKSGNFHQDNFQASSQLKFAQKILGLNTV